MAYPCVFCGQLKASKEHVYPKWLRSLQAPYDGVISVVETPQGNQVRPTQVPFDITVNTVCRDCNTGWMHDLEEATRPLLTRMIRGQLCELTLTDQHLLAQWVYKTVLMIHEQSRAASLVPPEHFKSLFKARVPPAGTAIWLATQTAPVVGPVSSVVFSTIDHHQIEDGQIPGGLDGTTFYKRRTRNWSILRVAFRQREQPDSESSSLRRSQQLRGLVVAKHWSTVVAPTLHRRGRRLHSFLRAHFRCLNLSGVPCRAAPDRCLAKCAWWAQELMSWEARPLLMSMTTAVSATDSPAPTSPPSAPPGPPTAQLPQETPALDPSR